MARHRRSLLEYLLCTNSSIGTRLATALLYGIKSDTFALSREVNEWDVEAFSYLYPLANQNLMRRIERPELPPAALDALSLALKNRRVIDKVAFVNLGRVERDDLIPQMADFSLSFEGIEWAFVSGVYDSNYIISVRNVGYVRAAGRVLKEAFGDIGAAGGHASMAKAIIPVAQFQRSGTSIRATFAKWIARSSNCSCARCIAQGKLRNFMRAVIQRVSSARVVIEGQEHSRIEAGILVLLGVEKEDTEQDAEMLARRIVELRIFEDEAGKMNRSIVETGGHMLAVSQFTLLGDCRKGRRPSFDPAAPPDVARTSYESFVRKIGALGVPVATGVFQAMMDVELTNQGPVTFILDSRKRF